jgi:hypothetical protein
VRDFCSRVFREANGDGETATASTAEGTREEEHIEADVQVRDVRQVRDFRGRVGAV